MQELNDAAIAAVAQLAREGMDPRMVPGGNIPYVFVPEGCKVQAVPELIFNEHTKAPERIKQNVSVFDPASFVHYFTLFNDENSRAFADETTLKVVAILDYHGAAEGSPRWGQHRVSLSLRQSEEWKTWIGNNNKQVTQTAFAEFLEQYSIDVTSPTPTAMREIANDLQATTEVEFGSGIRQQDGQVKFKYTETIKATVGAGIVAVPERFTIYIPAFVGGERVSMEALLRFRAKEGKLTFWYTLIRPEEVIRGAFITARNQIATDLGITIINGTAA